MSAKRLAAGGVAGAACLAIVVALAATPPSQASLAAQADVSSNWAGYVATGVGSTPTTASPSMSFTDVTGQWVQPKATCTPGTATSVAIWVGLGGYSESSRELEQTGTSADCSTAGKVSYYIWYELVPADSVNLKVKIQPGDVIASSVVVNGTDVLVQVNDRTRHVRFTKHLAMASPDLSSADWIVEAPSQCTSGGFCPQLALTNFHSVTFARSFAVGNNTNGTISSPNWISTELQLVPKSHRFYGDPNDPTALAGSAGAMPSAVVPDGSGFSVAWAANPMAAAGQGP
jgi:hypothetical protein